MNHSMLCEETKKELSSILQQMQQLKTDGVTELEALIAKHPDNLEIMGHLAGAYAYEGNHEKSIAVYQRYEELNPGTLEVCCRMADRHVNLGRFDEALGLYQTALNKDPNNIDPQMGIRYIHYLRRQKNITSPQGSNRKKLTRKQQKNQQQNKKEYQQKKNTLRSLPSMLYLEGTLKCNFACPMCSKGHDPYFAEDLHGDILNKVKKEIMPVICRIGITGFGEPTLGSTFDEMLEMSIENGSEVHFVTNLSTLNFQRIEKITSCPVSIILSIDGATKETFEKVRINSNFDLILEKLGMIRKLRQINQSHFLSHFSIHFVGLRMNIHELCDVVRLAARFEIPIVSVLDYSYNQTEFDEQSLRYEPVRTNKIFREAEKVARELGVHLCLPDDYDESPPAALKSGFLDKMRACKNLLPEPNRFPQRCNSPWQEPYIHTDGVVSPCCNSNRHLGDLSKHPFKKIWNGWRYRLFRWRIETSLPPRECRECFTCWGINGGNSGNVMGKEGLLIKAYYSLEWRLIVLWARLSKRLKMLARNKKTMQQKPNYFHGKPLKNKKADSEKSP